MTARRATTAAAILAAGPTLGAALAITRLWRIGGRRYALHALHP